LKIKKKLQPLTNIYCSKNVIEILKDCDVILHSGDINSQKVIDQLEAITTTYVVRGNADKEWAAALPNTLHLELYGIKIPEAAVRDVSHIQ